MAVMWRYEAHRFTIFQVSHSLIPSSSTRSKLINDLIMFALKQNWSIIVPFWLLCLYIKWSVCTHCKLACLHVCAVISWLNVNKPMYVQWAFMERNKSDMQLVCELLITFYSLLLTSPHICIYPEHYLISFTTQLEPKHFSSP